MPYGKPRCQRQQVNGLDLRYLEWENNKKDPTLVLLHGLRSHAYSWSESGRALAPYTRVIALDQRGRGDSSWAPDGDYSLEAHVRDLEAFVESLVPGQVVVAGESVGGRTAMAFAARRPAKVAGLIVADAGPEAPEQALVRVRQELRGTPESFTSWEEARQFILRERPAITVAALEERMRWMLKEDEGGRIVWRYDPAIREQCRPG